MVDTKAGVDSLVDFGAKTFGADYYGIWEDTTLLTLTLTDATGGTLAVGDTLFIKAGGNLKTADGLSAASTSSDIIGGTFGEAGGTISGTVTDEYNNPLVDVHVWAENYTGGGSAFGYTTVADGKFTISVPAGQYRIAAQADGRVRKYYDDTLIRAEAIPVNVTTGQSVLGINFTLVRGGAISGTVTDSQGIPLGGVSIGCRMVDVGQFFGNSTTTDPDGFLCNRRFGFWNL